MIPSLSLPHLALYRRALFLPLPALHRRYFILTASLRRAVIVIIKKKEKNEDERKTRKTGTTAAETQKHDGVRLSASTDKTYIADWLVPDNFKGDISQLHDSQPLIRVMARLKKHFETLRAIRSRDFVSVEMAICKGFGDINNRNANVLQDCDICGKIIARICTM